ncbi:sodium:neurotransmitter symporter family protein [Sarocladium implicatum]|nr:sodium:neurotransmitter symporter family protein [Sarocladium implicatum]
MGSIIKKIGAWLAPPPDKAADGRDQWPSRASFLLAAMGGCAGMGNLLRYPSQVYNNHGLQWYIPYLMAVFLVAIPVLVLEIAIGNAYRAGSVVAYNSMNYRLKGLGLSLLYVAFIVTPYFVANLAWIMIYFRHSFKSNLPWEGQAQDFYDNSVIRNPPPTQGSLSDDGTSVVSYTDYPAIGLIGETVGWTCFTWFLVWVSIFRGVGLTGRVVYFTMGLPIVVTIILIGRSVSLSNAGDGVKLYFATWRSSALADGRTWQTACGQVFFSTGVGFGYFTSYASYNRKHSNAVMDSILIVTSNVLFENIAAFAVFGVVGYLGMRPVEGEPLGAFAVGFLTLPEAMAQMPVPQLWCVLLFFTLMTLGYSSAFAMLDAIITLIMDAHPRLSRPLVVTSAVGVSLLLSLPYCTEFGYHLLTGIDRWTNDVALVFVVWAECSVSSTVYRWRDVVGQVGMKSYILYNGGYFAGMVFGNVLAHAVSPGAGAGMGFGLYFAGTIAALVLAKTPQVSAHGFMKRNKWTQNFWFLAFYSGNQLRNDLNRIVGQGKNWSIPSWWAVLLRYVSAPILSIVYAFSYPAFYQLRYDPLHILGFGVAHITLLIIFGGILVPRWFDVFIPPQRRAEGHIDNGAFAPAMEELVAEDAAESARKVDSNGNSSDARDKDEAAVTPPVSGSHNQGVMQSSPPPEYRDTSAVGTNNVAPGHDHTKEKI